VAAAVAAVAACPLLLLLLLTVFAFCATSGETFCHQTIHAAPTVSAACAAAAVACLPTCCHCWLPG